MQDDILIESLNEIKPIPSALSRLMAVAASGVASIQEVSDIIRYDPGLTADVLRFANSAASAPTSEITSVTYAMSRLGTEPVMRYLMGKWLKDTGQMKESVYGITSKQLWEHSVTVALAASMVTELLQEKNSGAVFTAAILHDIGLVVLSHAAAKLGIELEWDLGTSDIENRLADLERAVFGIDHAQAGALLLEQWKIPEEIVQAVRDHENEFSNASFLRDCIRLGNRVSAVLTMEEMMWPGQYPYATGERLHIGKEDFVYICQQVNETRDEVLQQYS
jgi:putative nucleotidyltransferase with HDIG domain